MPKRRAQNENENQEIELRTHNKKNLTDLKEEREKRKSPTISLKLINNSMKKNLR